MSTTETPQKDAYEAFIDYKTKAIKAIEEQAKSLEKRLTAAIKAVEKSFAAEKKAIEKKWKEVGVDPKAKEPKTTKPEIAKLTDAEIKAGLDEMFKAAPKLKGPVIFETLKITRTRFNKFLDANVNYIKIEGVRKNTLYVKR